jgi:hypothetical protein
MTRQAQSAPRESGLQAEATMVERLRREIAGMPARGEVASPQLLADFARAQKAFLDKKIEFERHRRAPATASTGSNRGEDSERRSECTPAVRPQPQEMSADPVIKREVPAGSFAWNRARLLLAAVAIALIALLAVWLLRS